METEGAAQAPAVVTEETMSKIETDFAIGVTKKMMSYPISSFFLKTSEIENFVEKRGNNDNMDLEKIMDKLVNRKYAKTEQWIKDVNLIWDRILSSSIASIGISIIAAELKNKFEKKTKIIPKNEIELWEFEIKKQNDKIRKITDKLLKDIHRNVENPIIPTNRIILKKKI